jgi:hypothetical protein
MEIEKKWTFYGFDFTIEGNHFIFTPDTTSYQINEHIVIIYHLQSIDKDGKQLETYIPYYVSNGHTNQLRANLLYPFMNVNDRLSVPDTPNSYSNYLSVDGLLKYDIIKNINDKLVKDTKDEFLKNQSQKQIQEQVQSQIQRIVQSQVQLQTQDIIKTQVQLQIQEKNKNPVQEKIEIQTNIQVRDIITYIDQLQENYYKGIYKNSNGIISNFSRLKNILDFIIGCYQPSILDYDDTKIQFYEPQKTPYEYDMNHHTTPLEKTSEMVINYRKELLKKLQYFINKCITSGINVKQYNTPITNIDKKEFNKLINSCHTEYSANVMNYRMISDLLSKSYITRQEFSQYLTIDDSIIKGDEFNFQQKRWKATCKSIQPIFILTNMDEKMYNIPNSHIHKITSHITEEQAKNFLSDMDKTQQILPYRYVYIYWYNVLSLSNFNTVIPEITEELFDKLMGGKDRVIWIKKWLEQINEKGGHIIIIYYGDPSNNNTYKLLEKFLLVPNKIDSFNNEPESEIEVMFNNIWDDVNTGKRTKRDKRSKRGKRTKRGKQSKRGKRSKRVKY